MSTPGVSLRALGLKIAEGLDCPRGGPHHVQETPVTVAAEHGGGFAVCQKCGVRLTLVSVD